MDVSTLAITIVALASLAWLGFLFSSSIAGGAGDEIPPNLRPYITDAEMETRRLDRTLATALTMATFLAISLPVYYLGESDRQAQAASKFDELAVERGRHIFEEEFLCVTCHGPGGVGGVAPATEERSGVSVSWAAPSLNDVFYRYDEADVRYWIVFGRANTPMPAWGLEGGGPMNSEQVEEVIAYLRSIQIPQEEALVAVDQRVQAELDRLENSETIIMGQITAQEQVLADLQEAPAQLGPAEGLLEALNGVLLGAGSGIDSDGDGLSDTAEQQISDISQQAEELLGGPTSEPGATTTTIAPQEQGATTTTAVPGATTTTLGQATLTTGSPTTTAAGGATTLTTAAGVTTTVAQGAAPAPTGLAVILDPTNPTSTLSTAGEPVGDDEVARDLVSDTGSEVNRLRSTVEKLDQLVEEAQAGLDFLQTALEEQRYAFDFREVADRSFGGDVEEARRAVGLFNAYCARCHTSGYSAGAAFTLEAGSGGLGPSLAAGRTLVQFPDREEHVGFVINGSVNGVGYGVNGVGTGRMPGFGQSLPLEDIERIVDFERGL